MPYLLAFLAGFQILVVEMCGGRFINLELGSAIYGWTALIGIVLGGVSLGNVVGGRLAEGSGLRSNLGLVCCMSALMPLYVARMSPLLGYAVAWYPDVSWSLKVFVVVGLLLFLPSAVMGMISPMAAKWALALMPERPGEVLGTMGALGTWGAILGTMLPGFYLIGVLGTTSLLLTCMCLMGLPGLWLLGAQHLRWGSVPVGWLPFSLVILAMLWTWPIGTHREAIRAAQIRQLDPDGRRGVIYVDESDYFTIKVAAQDPTATPRRLSLVLDVMVHGFITEGQPARLDYDYEHVYSWVTRRWQQHQTTIRNEADVVPRALHLGGGSYTFPRWIDLRFPGATQLVAEIDPQVTEAVHATMELPRDTAIVTRIEDARRVVETEADGTYDLVYGDVFNSFSVPYHLTTLEFMGEVKRLLASGGVYQMNVIDLFDRADPARGQFVASMVKTLDAVFGEDQVHVWVCHDPAVAFAGARRSTYVLVATTDGLDLQRLGHRTWDPPPSPTQENARIMAIEGEELRALRGTGMVLTDDFCPVEQMLAPVAATIDELAATEWD